ncbi:hypothetical protein I6A84_36545 [Frankia sp. CNm7]|uniref:Membrane protein involved in the export of O-antigen and teichoic acid n=1 Tax=Frankia nepalensis TaxID=1836974 RepID=A0A937RLS4_9ACTN|nr:hypothetical protein [Frankia nepalensis]MBL7501411.1 hypothetical protein [Frankia nepalensis]MBL7511938.1 hypothetical protein [Frankia nepalensis]MBL7523421.1 hypothetical protein [Frankia nepalensis]MBL7628241.1 hypothetical protein [Frankia nepalensis]
MSGMDDMLEPLYEAPGQPAPRPRRGRRAEERLPGLEAGQAAESPAAPSNGDQTAKADQATKADQRSLYRNGLALALASALNAVLGAGFWVFAAHSVPRAELGQATALVSALMGLSMLGQLNLGPALAAFLPVAGSRRARLVGGSYLAAVTISLLLGFGFAVVAPRVSSSFSSLHDARLAVFFGVGVAVWSLFALQDSVLTGLRRATWVPIEMTAYNVSKFGLLALLGGGSALAVIQSWVAPAALALLPVSYLLFTRVLPSKEPPLPGSDATAFRRFLAGESTAMVLDQLGTTLLPVLVVAMVGSEAGAAFGLAWMMTNALDALVYGMGSSLVVEGSQPGADVRALYRALRRRVLLMLGGIVAVCELGAPLLLSVFGAQYADDATTVFRLLILASVPRALVVLAMCAARAERRIGWVVRVHLALAVLVPAGALALCQLVGLAGAGLAWAAAHVVVTLGVLLDEARDRAPAPVPAPAAASDTHETMVLTWRPTPLPSMVLPQHSGLVDANVTMSLSRVSEVTMSLSRLPFARAEQGHRGGSRRAGASAGSAEPDRPAKERPPRVGWRREEGIGEDTRLIARTRGHRRQR